MPTFSTDAERWDAVKRRDPAADGRFVYSVATTGVYCRPSCPSRPARRENVAFHESTAAAEAAGFRACKRCRPDGPAQTERHAALVAAACRRIEAAENEPSLDGLASAAGLSPFHFHRLFKRLTGVTPKAYAAARRAERARAELTAAGSITQAIYGAGYSGSGRFYAEASAVLGMTPSAYRRGGERARIRFAVGACSLGHVLVAATDKGVCAIRFGDDPQALVEALQDSFPKAELIGADADFERTVGAVIAHVEQPSGPLDLPLDVRGTAFQRRVWEALRAIPAGATASYAEIAAAIGAPSAVRAVAGACAANSIAVAIPCHRVVRTDGSLSGYRWGVERKRQLLAREALNRSA
jgi:AraC family transcriptional regulator, regulatory protein of adaptative response / methylated-DNA-[protein]-cysteine methyltransferase